MEPTLQAPQHRFCPPCRLDREEKINRSSSFISEGAGGSFPPLRLYFAKWESELAFIARTFVFSDDESDRWNLCLNELSVENVDEAVLCGVSSSSFSRLPSSSSSSHSFSSDKALTTFRLSLFLSKSLLLLLSGWEDDSQRALELWPVSTKTKTL